MDIKFGIGAKFILMGFIVCAALAWVIYSGYASSTFALNNFKITTDSKYPILARFQKLTSSFAELRNKSNEIISDYSAKSALEQENDRQRLESELLAALENISFLKGELKYSERIKNIETLIKECAYHSKSMTATHINRINFFYEINGVYVPLSAMISLRELDHMNWVNDLRKSIDTGAEFKGQTDPAKCGFGKWYSSAEIKVPELKKIFDRFDAPHKKLHEYAPRIKDLIKEGKLTEADSLLKSEVINVLNEIKSEFKEFREKTDALFKEASDKISANYKNLNEKGEKSKKLMEEIEVEINKEISGFVANSEQELSRANGSILLIGILIFVFVIAYVTITTRSVNSIIKAILSESAMLIDAVKSGKLDIRGNAEAVNFEFREIITGINDLMESFIKPLKLTSKYISDISRGEIPAKITAEYAGDFNEIKNSLNRCINAVNALIKDSSMLSGAACEGRLSTRADASRHFGDYRTIVEGFNNTLDAVIKPMEEASDCLYKMAEGDLDICVKGDYKGDHAKIKNSLNTTIDAINEILSQVKISAEQVNTGSLQVSDASRSLSQSATEAASSIEEISATMQEINSQTRQNAENAIQANKLSTDTSGLAENGNRKMLEMKKSMSEISAASASVAKIIKTIDEIAFQTNLLALNSSVEAARAGKHGKGFTVVAEEVRNLAQRSAKAAKETAEMIANSVNKTEQGTKIVSDTASSLEAIVGATAKVTDIIGEIAAAAREQEKAIDQINQGLNQIDQVTQQNTATAEESAAASQELLSQAKDLKSMLLKFKLKNSSSNFIVKAEKMAAHELKLLSHKF